MTSKNNSTEPCPLCKCTAPEVYRWKSRNFFCCPACDLIFVPRRHHVSQELARARYEKHENSLQNAGYVLRLARMVELLRRFTAGAHRVLDYGCGPTPVLVELLKRAGYDAAGYDPLFANNEPVANCDAVVSTETFEHFAEPAEELDRIVSLLVPCGCLIIATQFHNGPDSLRDWWYLRDATHVTFYSPATFDFIANRWGLTILHRDDLDTIVLRRNQ